MRSVARPLALLLAAVLCLASAVAQEKPARKEKPAKPEPTPAAAEGEKPKRPGLLKRIFGGGGREKAPEGQPAAPEPPPEKKRPSRSRNEQKPTPEPEGDATVRPPKPAAEPAVAPAPAPAPTAERPPTPAPGKIKAQAPVARATPAPDPLLTEKARYDEVRSRALADPKIAELRQKADEAPTEEAGRQELRAYNKALFQKMRALDPSLKDRIDRMETAVLKQLGGTN